ncbi:diguanylate cyclase domain-containing protein [Vibrio gangliei]|uniref:diguanylate cyclase domain-containing protein n=1 Tax=Vibrio gangliei TaxID=2077090 RepID=UPI000D016504|nr:diguanylate cyclase [Vibrio gangliei]
MKKKPLSILPIVLLSIVIVIAIGYTVSQFYNVEKRLHSATDAIFHKAVDASYDIIDTTINESLKNYLHGIAFSTQQVINVTHDKKLHLDEVLVKKSLDQLISNTHIGDSGYISILNSSGIYTSHPYLQNEDVSDLDIIQKQLAEPETFLEYQWKNPNDEQSRLKFAYSIKLSDGSVISASVYKDEMLSLVNKDLLKDKLKRYNFGETGYVYVVDSQGKLLLHPTSEGQSIHTLIGDSTYAFMNQVKTKPEGSFTYPLKLSNGKTVLKTVAYKYYPYLDWIIAAGISQQELSQPTDQLWHSLIMAGISLLLVIAGLILGLNSRHKRLIMIERKDFLTGLNNRRSFMESASDYVKKSNSGYSVIIFDIDKFKSINDTYGHNEGDKAIVATAEVLAKFESDYILVSRHGGEEFVMLLQDMNASQAYLMAEIIRQKVTQINTLQTRFTISAGVYESVYGRDNISEAISHADHALYNVKQTGRNKVIIYQPEHDQQILNKQ